MRRRRQAGRISTLPPDREPSPARSALERARGLIAVSRSWPLRAGDGSRSVTVGRSHSLVAVSRCAQASITQIILADNAARLCQARQRYV